MRCAWDRSDPRLRGHIALRCAGAAAPVTLLSQKKKPPRRQRCEKVWMEAPAVGLGALARRFHLVRAAAAGARCRVRTQGHPAKRRGKKKDGGSAPQAGKPSLFLSRRCRVSQGPIPIPGFRGAAADGEGGGGGGGLGDSMSPMSGGSVYSREGCVHWTAPDLRRQPSA